MNTSKADIKKMKFNKRLFAFQVKIILPYYFYDTTNIKTAFHIIDKNNNVSFNNNRETNCERDLRTI